MRNLVFNFQGFWPNEHFVVNIYRKKIPQGISDSSEPPMGGAY